MTFSINRFWFPIPTVSSLSLTHRHAHSHSLSSRPPHPHLHAHSHTLSSRHRRVLSNTHDHNNTAEEDADERKKASFEFLKFTLPNTFRDHDGLAALIRMADILGISDSILLDSGIFYATRNAVKAPLAIVVDTRCSKGESSGVGSKEEEVFHVGLTIIHRSNGEKLWDATFTIPALDPVCQKYAIDKKRAQEIGVIVAIRAAIFIGFQDYVIWDENTRVEN